VIANLQLQASGVEERRHFAHRIALDLFRCPCHKTHYFQDIDVM
jgi:hypothetical protein